MPAAADVNIWLPAPPGEVELEVPGKNAGGADDWALLVETQSP